MNASSSTPHPQPGPTPTAHPADTAADPLLSALARVLDDVVAGLETGSPPSKARLVAAHPELAPHLEHALDSLELLHPSGHAPASIPTRIGDFQIVREIGRGGMGVVYEAEQLSLRRRVALKILRSINAIDDAATQRFRREAETVAQLHHTNIVPIFAVGADQGVHYYAMQFIEGRDLADLTRPGDEPRPLPPPRTVAEWGLQAADALAHAHAHGVIHRDIKPSNLILAPDGRIWLTDFGLARRIDDLSLSLTGAFLGTPRYMSPEQAAATTRPVDHRTDIYSLGATLYELTTGRPLFEGASAHLVLAQILHQEPLPPRRIVKDLPRDLETILLRSLAKDPAARYASARDLAADLRAFLDGRPLRARRPGPAERAARWFRQHRRAVILSASSATAAALVLALGTLAAHTLRTRQFGQLRLSANDPSLQAEVLDANGRPILPSLPLPLSEPVPLRHGTYQLRISAPGERSETWPLDITRSRLAGHHVQLTPRTLWPPRDDPAGEAWAIEAFPGRDHAQLLAWIQPLGTTHPDRSPCRLRLLDGASGQPLWDLPFNLDHLPAGQDPEEWRTFLLRTGVVPAFHDTALAERAHDLDGDGVADVILLSRSNPSLLAVSGRSGQVLWWHRGSPGTLSPVAHAGEEVIASPTAPAPSRRGRGFVVGIPATRDVDGDGIPEVIACYHSEGDVVVRADGRPENTGRQSWISAVSGRTGQPLWQQPLPGPWEAYASTSTARDTHDALVRPALGHLPHAPIVALLTGNTLRGWDTRTGAPAWPDLQLDVTPRRAPDLIDLDGDGASEALVVEPQSDPNATTTLVALRLPTGERLWSRPLQSGPAFLAAAILDPRRHLHHLTDLDADGRPEILALAGQLPDHLRRETHLELLEPATGIPRWRRTLEHHAPVHEAAPEARCLTGPDLDQDGHAEVFVAWPCLEPDTQRPALAAAALSGRHGDPLWLRHHPGFGPALALQWGPPGSRGHPSLVIAATPGNAGRSATLLVDAASGRTDDLLPDVLETQSGDFDGDAVHDLFVTFRRQGTTRRSILQGTPPEPWRRLGDWRPVQDLDRDGFTDLAQLTDTTLVARSGRDGHLLWTGDLPWNSQPALPPPTLRAGDQDGDGVPDLAVLLNAPRDPGPDGLAHVRTLAFLSGRSGRILHIVEGFDLGNANTSGSQFGWSFTYPAFASADLDDDGAAEILALNSRDGQDVTLTVLAGAQRRPAWSQTVVLGSIAGHPRPQGLPIADVDGNGTPDLALLLASAGGSELNIVEGATGRPLWPRGFSVVHDPRHLAWPEPTLGDLDGDTHPEVAVVRHGGYQDPGGYTCEVVVLDGRSGQVRWTWTWPAGFPELWPPVVVPNPAGPGGFLALGLRQSGFDGLVILDARGRVVVQRALTLPRHSLQPGLAVWGTSALAPGSPASALTYFDDGHLVVAEAPEFTVRWRCALPDEAVRLLRPSSSDPEGSHLVLWAGRRVLGLDPATGTPRWRTQVLGRPHPGDAHDSILCLLAAGDGEPFPRVQWTGRAGSGNGTVVHAVHPWIPR